ncbi:helix-turn-helix domain-containing protein [Methylobacterium sp. JK268]
MSVQAITFVVGQHIPDAGAKLLAMVLANYVDHRTGLAWPTVEALADDTSQSVRTVQRKLRELEQLGLITILKGACPKTGRQRANRYRMHLPGLPPLRGDRTGGAGAAEPARGDRLTPHTAVEGCHSDGGEGDSVVTPGGDTAVTPLKESVRGTVRRESPQPPVTGGPAHGACEGEGNGATAPAVGFEQLLAAYPESGRAWANLQAARGVFGALGAAERRQAIAAAAAYAAHCGRDPTIKPKHLQNWLRNGLFRNHPGPGGAGEAAAGGRPEEARVAAAAAMVARGEWPIGGTVFVAADSVEAAAWERYFAQFGTRPRWTDLGRGRGWKMPTALPPCQSAVRRIAEAAS